MAFFFLPNMTPMGIAIASKIIVMTKVQIKHLRFKHLFELRRESFCCLDGRIWVDDSLQSWNWVSTRETAKTSA